MSSPELAGLSPRIRLDLLDGAGDGVGEELDGLLDPLGLFHPGGSQGMDASSRSNTLDPGAGFVYLGVSLRLDELGVELVDRVGGCGSRFHCTYPSSTSITLE